MKLLSIALSAALVFCVLAFKSADKKAPHFFHTNLTLQANHFHRFNIKPFSASKSTNSYCCNVSPATSPVILTVFKALLKNGKRVITWATSQEINIDHFELEYSTTTSNFISIASIPATNTLSSKSYSFTDNISSVSAISYYRLKIADKDGGEIYSTVTPVKNSSLISVIVFPNPATDNIVISAISDFKNARIKISDITGKVVLTHLNVNGTKAFINISSLPTGVYYIKIDDSGSIVNSRFLKQ